MTAFTHLERFISSEMRMSQIYQPVMLIELLLNGGNAKVEDIAKALVNKDPTQVEYYSLIVKNMVGKVLTKNRGITEKLGNTYKLLGADELTPDQVKVLIQLCQNKIKEFENRRGQTHWEHRRRGHRPISGSVRYEVLKRAKFRCELCGISAEDKALEVDHIHPKSLGGADDLANYQALCYSCNAAKRNTDDTDFRGLKSLYDLRDCDCLFCQVQVHDTSRIITENSLAYAILDSFPVTQGHTLIIPKRHVSDYFGLSQAEVNATNQIIKDQKPKLLADDISIDGFNIGMNCGEAAGQSVFHCHIHLIPRRRGDVEMPRGGIRNVIPGKGNY